MDTYDFLADPRTLTLTERHDARTQYEHDQAEWLTKLRLLADAPKPDDDFPAFLLATQPFADLAHKLKKATKRSQLTIDVADEMDWFLQAFADYLRTDEGEEVFPQASHVPC